MAALHPALCRLADGTWRCTADHRTGPCGDCAGCREVYAERISLDRTRKDHARPPAHQRSHRWLD